MATNKLQIYNQALVRLGQNRLDSITEDSDPRRTLDAIYDQVLEEVTAAGPEKGWKFAKRRERVDVESCAISAFADYGSTVTGTVQCTTSTAHNLLSGEIVEISGTTNYNDEYEVTFISTTSFYFTGTWVADDATGTARWTSEEYEYRYPVPTHLRLVSVQVGGLELTDWVQEGQYVLTNAEDEDIDMVYVRSITDTTLFPPHFTKVLWFSLAIEAAYGQIQSATAPERLRAEYDERILPKAIAMDERQKYVQESSTAWVDTGHTSFTVE